MSTSTAHVFYPLTPAQKAHLRRFPPNSMWRTALWKGQKITGPLDADGLVKALQRTTVKYDALRLGLARQEGVLVQRVRDPLPIGGLVTAKNIKAQSAEQFYRYVDLFLAAETTRQWDLEKEYPFRFFLLRYSPTLHVLVLGFAHLFVDGESSEIVERELWREYAGLDTDEEGRGCSVRFFESIGGAHAGDAVGQEETYWQSRHSDIPPTLQVHDSVCDPDSAPATAHHNVQIAGEELTRLRASIRESRYTEFQWLLASFALSVFALTLQDGLKFSITMNMRSIAQKEAVGMFAHRVPVILKRQSSHTDMLSHAHREVLKSMRAYRRMDPDLLDQAMDRLDEAASEGASDDLTINYRLMKNAAAIKCGNLEIARYHSAKSRTVSYTPRGLDAKFFSTPHYLDCHFIANSAVIPPEAQNTLLACFRDETAAS